MHQLELQCGADAPIGAMFDQGSERAIRIDG